MKKQSKKQGSVYENPIYHNINYWESATYVVFFMPKNWPFSAAFFNSKIIQKGSLSAPFFFGIKWLQNRMQNLFENGALLRAVFLSIFRPKNHPKNRDVFWHVFCSVFTSKKRQKIKTFFSSIFNIKFTKKGSLSAPFFFILFQLKNSPQNAQIHFTALCRACQSF